MCGIFGYYQFNVSRDRRQILQLLITGLRRLEYRGYDSAGLCIDSVPLPPPLASPPSEGHQRSKADERDDGPEPLIVKATGAIDFLEQEVKAKIPLDLMADAYSVHVGIAHTRWATHGPPSAVNSHPHVSDPSGEFVVVHNGIITNYQVLKDFLKHKGFEFESETDTEVIPKLLRWLYDNKEEPVTFPQLVTEVMGLIQGAYALLIKARAFPGELVACKKGSPLILGVRSSSAGVMSGTGVGSGGLPDDPVECFIASDASAVVEHTKRVLVLEDGDLVHVSGPGYTVYNHQGPQSSVRDTSLPTPLRAAQRAITTLTMEVSEIMKSGYDHFMKKEIHEQPDSLLQTMRGRVVFPSTAPPGEGDLTPKEGRLPSSGGSGFTLPSPSAAFTTQQQLNWSFATGHGSGGVVDAQRARMHVHLGGLIDHVDTIRRSSRMMLVACGSSYHACVAARQALEELSDLPVALELASDFLDRTCPIHRNDTIFFVSQSGETADTLQALKYAKARGALCVGITNTVGSAIARETHCGVHINAGCEIGVASTKAYTSQIVVLIMIGLLLSEDFNSKRARHDEIVVGLRHLPDLVRECLKLDEQMASLADQIKNEDSLLVFGRGYNYATALESALKVKEIAYLHTEGIQAGEMKHGPLALVDEKLQLLVIATRDAMYSKMMSVVQQLKARSGRMIVLCNVDDREIEGHVASNTVLVRVPHTVDCLQPIINIVPLQLLAYHLAVKRGINVDQPRNLAKSVTVTD